MDDKTLAKTIDHTLLRPDATPEEICAVCAEAVRYGTASVCVNAFYVPLVHASLKGSGVKTCAVVGFPLGATSSAVKAFEAQSCVENGADEVDMVQNVGLAKAGDWAGVAADIRAVTEAVRGRALVKVILETCLLTDEEKRLSCLAAKEAGADFVKTSTGFSTGGATEADIALMRAAVGPDMGVKASGGVRTRGQAEAMLASGATRIGASSSRKILEG